MGINNSLALPNTLVNGTLIDATPLMADLAYLLSTLNRAVLDGGAGAINAGANVLQNLAPGVLSTDAATVGQLGDISVPFGSLGTVVIPPGAFAFVSSGYAATGDGGAGMYVADATANATLAAAYPAQCKADAAGRYWRLAGEYVTVEQAGATGVVGHNDQPAIQAAVSYAAAVGIGSVRFTKRAYELWCPIRTTQTGPGGASDTDGYPILITKSVALVGLPGGSTLTFMNSLGGAKTTITQTTAWGQWQGGGIYVNANSPGATADIPVIHFENLTLAGTTADWVSGNGGSNISDKGMMFASNGTYGVARLILRNVIAHHFSGEIFYGGAFKTGSTIVAENVELYHSQQSAWNPTGLGKVFAVNLYAHDAYLASEIILGDGHTYVDCKFANAYNAGCISTQYFVGGYYYGYPNRDLTKAPTWCTYIGTTFQNITTLTISSWTRGSITTIDTSFGTSGLNDRDIYLDIEHWVDQTGGNGCSIGGPATLTTQFPSCPAGVYYEPPKNIHWRIKARRTARAVANSLYLDTVYYTGLIDQTTVRVDISGETRNAISPFVGSRPAGYGQPLTVVDPAIGLMTGGQPYGGSSDTPSTAKNYDVNWSALSFTPSGGGSYPVTLNNTYAYADGQLVTFYYKGGSGAMTFAASGAGMSLPALRTLSAAGDKLVLRWDSLRSTWVEELYSPNRQREWTGSASITPASLASGAQATLGTITATGAAVGDFVSAISAGVASAGVRLWGEVTAANTVTVYARNDSGSAYNPGATTYYARVVKQT